MKVALKNMMIMKRAHVSTVVRKDARRGIVKSTVVRKLKRSMAMLQASI